MIINGGEFGFIDRIRQWIRADGKGVVLGIGDDAAVLLPPPGKLLAACDMLVEGVHFERDYITPWQLGWKALAVNISDIAAMGGIPLFALVSMGIADWMDTAYVQGIYQGMLDIADRFGVQLVGGDTVRSPKASVMNIAILGSTNSPVTRAGARPGHLIAVTGCLGGAAAGLACLEKLSRRQGLIVTRNGDVRMGTQSRGHAGVQQGFQAQSNEVQTESYKVAAEQGTTLPDGKGQTIEAAWPDESVMDESVMTEAIMDEAIMDESIIDELIKAHLEPMPKVSEGRALASTGVVSAMMDISDGLAGEVHHIARESEVGVVIREDAVPISESTLRAAELLECDPFEWALSGGEDFELVFTFHPESTDVIRNALSGIGGSMYIVGHITPKTEGIVLIDSNGIKRNLLLKGYDHFDGTSTC